MKYNEQEKAIEQLINDKETTTCKEYENDSQESERRGNKEHINNNEGINHGNYKEQEPYHWLKRL
eukprot:16429118-Heterocapsa_arctica.AAC.1